MQGFALPWSRNSFRLRFWFTFKRVSLFWDFVHSTTKMIFGWGFVSSLSRDMFIVIFTLIIWEMINWEMMIWWSILMINWSDDNHHPPWSSDLYFHLDHLRKDLGKAEKIFSHWQPTVLPGKNIDLIEIQFLGIPRASKNKSKKNKNKKNNSTPQVESMKPELSTPVKAGRVGKYRSSVHLIRIKIYLMMIIMTEYINLCFSVDLIRIKINWMTISMTDWLCITCAAHFAGVETFCRGWSIL